MNLLRISSLRLKTKILLACAVLAISGIISIPLLLPRLLDLETFKSRISAQVGDKLNGSLHIERLECSWLPLPHLNLRNTRFTSEETALAVPLAKVYPDWWALLRGQLRIGEVMLVDPEAQVQQLPTSFAKPPDPELAGLEIVIHNGSLQVAEGSQFSFMESRGFLVKSLNGSVAPRLAAIDFNLSGTPEAGGHLAFSGQYLRHDASYRLKFSCRNFNLHYVFASFAKGALIPGDSPLNLTGSLEGRGLAKITGKLAGDSPCLLAFPQDKKIQLNCGVVDLAFAKDGNDLLLTLNEFELREPGLKLAGAIRRSVSGKAEDAPLWQIELTGEDLNLTQIREAVLSMWGDNKIVKELGEIVQGGTAGKASYSFKGTAADFEYVRKMRATAEDIDGSFVIPEGKLPLTKVKGRMKIENGLLVVDGDQAWLGNSRGKNGRLVLGLPDDDFTFKLDVDLDADLAELPESLERLVTYQPFLAELAKFSKVSGRATGHLRLGDHLRNFKIALEVDSMQGKGRYAPLAWDFAIEGGELSLAPPLMKWKNVHGAYGPHVVKKTAGQVRWPDDVFLDLTQLEAALAVKELEKEDLSYFKAISGALHEKIIRAAGRIELRNTTISGKASKPELWKADTDVLAQNLIVETPLFPEPLRIKQGKAHLSNTAITISEATGSIFGDSFTIVSSLSHQAFTALRGKISLKGKVGHDLGQWLKDRQLVAPALFPRLPIQINAMQIDLQENKTLIAGQISPDAPISNQPRADISLELTRDNPLKMAAHIYGGKEEARITVDFLDNISETFLFSWKGALSGKTVDQLVEKNNLLHGRVAGDFQLYLPQDPNKIAFTGELEAKNLRWFLDEKAGRFVDIYDLQLNGVGRELTVKHLACALNGKESMVVNGRVSQVADGLDLKLNLESKALSRKTLLDFQEALTRIRAKASQPTPAGSPPQRPPWNITGTVAFAVDKFTSAHQSGENELATMVWQPLQGEIKIHPQSEVSAHITNGRLCCLDTMGEWFSTPELGINHFAVNSASCSVQPRFETVLPCLGYPQDIIEGEFSLNGHLSGGVENWQEGQLQINSKQGRILRMKLLAKIFSVVNIIDLFKVGQTEDGAKTSTHGFPYTDLIFKTHVKDNELIIDEAVVRGEGLNLFARGKMNLSTFELDAVVLISPFKTFDAIVSKVPLVGRVIGGETATLITFPVGVTGKISDPQVTLLPPSAIGEGLVNIIKRTLLLPFYIFSPIMPEATEPEKKQ